RSLPRPRARVPRARRQPRQGCEDPRRPFRGRRGLGPGARAGRPRHWRRDPGGDRGLDPRAARGDAVGEAPMIRAVAVAVLLLVGCGSSNKPASAPVAPRLVDTPATPDDLHAFVLDQYTQLGQGYDSVFLEGLDHDERLGLVGVRPIDLAT